MAAQPPGPIDNAVAIQQHGLGPFSAKTYAEKKAKVERLWKQMVESKAALDDIARTDKLAEFWREKSAWVTGVSKESLPAAQLAEYKALGKNEAFMSYFRIWLTATSSEGSYAIAEKALKEYREAFPSGEQQRFANMCFIGQAPLQLATLGTPVRNRHTVCRDQCC